MARFEIRTPEVPIRFSEQDLAYIGQTRVTLSTVVGVFNQGYTPEDIVQSFDSLKLADVYAVLAYYLRHREEIDDHLKQQREEADAYLAMMEANDPKTQAVRAKLKARQNL